MTDLVASLEGAELAEWERALRAAEVSHRPPAPAFDPMRPVAALESLADDAVRLVRRGVRMVPVAETLPLLPLYARSKQQVPAEIRVAHETQGYDFYLVQVTFNLLPEDDQTADYAEFAVAIYDGVEGPRASRAIEVFPRTIQSTWLKAEGGVHVSLHASLQFEASPIGVHGVKAEAGAGAGASAKVIAGPFKVAFGTTELEVVGTGDREIKWIYRTKGALSGKTDFRSFLVLKVASHTPAVRLGTKIGVRTYRRTWETLWIREHMPILRAEKMLELEIGRGSLRG
jgi:hypothetical protein